MDHGSTTNPILHRTSCDVTIAGSMQKRYIVQPYGMRYYHDIEISCKKSGYPITNANKVRFHRVVQVDDGGIGNQQ